MTIIRRSEIPEGVAIVGDVVVAPPEFFTMKLVVMLPEDAEEARGQLQALSIRSRNEQCKQRQKKLRDELRQHVVDCVNQHTAEVDTLGGQWEEIRDRVELSELVRLFAVVAGQVNPEPLQKLVAAAMGSTPNCKSE